MPLQSTANADVEDGYPFRVFVFLLFFFAVVSGSSQGTSERMSDGFAAMLCGKIDELVIGGN